MQNNQEVPKIPARAYQSANFRNLGDNQYGDGNRITNKERFTWFTTKARVEGQEKTRSFYSCSSLESIVHRVWTGLEQCVFS